MTTEEPLAYVVDLFSGAGGMSYGFFAHPDFHVVGAADVEVGKPSTGHGAIGCNTSYEANMGVAPLPIDLGLVSPPELEAQLFPTGAKRGPLILLACPPCTGFSRAMSTNYIQDDPRNSLVRRVVDFAARLRPVMILMENVPQLVNGSFRSHFYYLNTGLAKLGYNVHAGVHNLSRFGLPQARERALIIAVQNDVEMHTLEDLWRGFQVTPEAVSVRRAIQHLRPLASGETDPFDSVHSSTRLVGDSLERIQAIPHDGGSWPDLLDDPTTQRHLIPSMWKAVERGRLNSYCDIYGRLRWARPAPTIKRECSHVGNGRYAHPEQDRQCTVRELAILQGFPSNYLFKGTSRKNLYRQVGDAVPPLVSYQLAWVARWILTGERPSMDDVVLLNTSLMAADILPVAERYESLTLC